MIVISTHAQERWTERFGLNENILRMALSEAMAKGDQHEDCDYPDRVRYCHNGFSWVVRKGRVLVTVFRKSRCA